MGYSPECQVQDNYFFNLLIVHGVLIDLCVWETDSLNRRTVLVRCMRHLLVIFRKLHYRGQAGRVKKNVWKLCSKAYDLSFSHQ